MKKTILWILMESIFIIIFNLLFFLLLGTDHKLSVWISYGFIHFSYLFVIVTPFLVKKCKRQDVFGASLASISVAYFFVEFIVGLVFTFVNTDNFAIPLVIQAVLAGIYLILLLWCLIVNENTAEKLERHEKEIQFVKSVSSQLQSLSGICDDKNTKRQLDRLYSVVHTSQARSDSSVEALEMDIIDKVNDLENMILNRQYEDANTMIMRIKLSVDKRNSTLKQCN